MISKKDRINLFSQLCYDFQNEAFKRATIHPHNGGSGPFEKYMDNKFREYCALHAWNYTSFDRALEKVIKTWRYTQDYTETLNASTISYDYGKLESTALIFDDRAQQQA